MGISTSCFSKDYFSARARFRELATRAGGRLESLPLSAKGPRGEALSIDIAWFGATDPERLLLHSSGLHGVEGFAGSAIQLQLLESLPAIPANAALVIVHILNPYGMAWLRRTNEENVDLNRNCLEADAYSGAPAMYARCDGILNPKSPPDRDGYFLKVLSLVLRHGMPALKQAVAGGQYAFPLGLFFGGSRMQAGIAQYREFLQNNFRATKRVVAIDVHTGLGKYAQDILLVDAPHYDTMRGTFGTRVAPLEADRSAAYRVRGGLQSLIFRAPVQADVAFVGQEFGTYHALRVLHALREENRWHHFGKATLDHPVKARLKQVFCPDDESWRGAVLARGADLLNHAVQIVFTNERSIHI